MLLKINYLKKNVKNFYFCKFYKTIYKTSLYSEFFYKLNLKYLRLYLKKSKYVNLLYKRILKKRAVLKNIYIRSYMRRIIRRNRGSKIKGYFFKKKIKKKKSYYFTKKKKSKYRPKTKKKFKYKRYF